ncbi:MAG TPA: AtpZ/AtpI family protein [Candidatus Mcinerneyibacteriales bacterium]|nr:AtpZ/AtpI family protein [Candidatus Mcinerneyibacteriales bacterium]HPQ89561.1 AtpZ/AtpI family protein [Candidatus Mcinerneyibacteriales bacterium]
MRPGFKYFVLFSQISFVVVISIVLFLYLGTLLDKHVSGHNGLFTILGLFVGLGSAGYNTYKLFLRFVEEVKKDENEEREKKT